MEAAVGWLIVWVAVMLFAPSIVGWLGSIAGAASVAVSKDSAAGGASLGCLMLILWLGALGVFLLGLYNVVMQVVAIVVLASA